MSDDDLTTSVELFLSYAIKLEEEATLRFGQLADAMEGSGNHEVGKLFRKLSDYSRLHLADAKARAGFRDVPVMLPREYQWPDFESPETAAIWATDPMIAYDEAIEIALESEKRGHAFYKKVFEEATNPEIRVLAKEFVEEEAEHVMWLEQWIDERKQSAAMSGT
ncbi:MAG: ferritin family protein [Hyphomicrobiaceae bacterium]|nr:ferritin family protein [Hyphomicrobiaceae bacterium]MCC0006546.1 ferritin family protein [Hyphomicrobiaceae bacterium]